MNETLKAFTIKDIDLFRDDENVDFAIAEVYFISDGNNAQNCPISTEVLKRDSNTALGKPLVAKYHKVIGDVGSHELEEIIVGWIPESSIIEFKEKDGKLFAVAKAVVSKIYATEVYQLFLDSNERAVSCEFSAYQPNADYLGEGEIEGFVIRGITLLGKSVRPCVEGADIKLIKFSEKEANEFYTLSTSTNVLKNFAEDRKNKLKIKSKKQKKFEVSNDDNEEEKMAEEEVKDFTKTEEEEIIMSDEKEDEIEEKDKSFEEDVKDDEESEEVEDKKDEEEKKFSLDAYADCGATIAFLEHETEQNKALAEKVMKEMSAEDIVKTVVEFAKEVEDLKKFKKEIEEQEKQKKFNSIMASVKEDLDEKTFSDLYKEGENVSLIDMNGFENKVKAFAYEATKKKTVEETELTDFKFAVDGELNKSNDDGDVFAKIANK